MPIFYFLKKAKYLGYCPFFVQEHLNLNLNLRSPFPSRLTDTHIPRAVKKREHDFPPSLRHVCLFHRLSANEKRMRGGIFYLLYF